MYHTATHPSEEGGSAVQSIRRAVVGAFVEHWTDSVQLAEFLYVALGQLAAVAVFAWLAKLSGRGDIVSSVAFGVVLMITWRASVFRLGFLVVGANNQGTLELEMMSRAPMFWIMLGKTLAAVAFYGLIGVGCFFVAIWVGGSGVVVGNPAVLAGSMLVAALSVIAFAYVFAPFTFLLGGQAGFFNAIFPLGILLSGFVQPVGLLPPLLEVPARLLPTSWATEALMMGLQGEPVSTVAVRWGVSLALTLATFLASAWMFVRCESIVRERGGL